MKQQIEQIIKAITNKRNELVDEARNKFDNIQISDRKSPSVPKQGKRHQTPPISYILYGVGGLSLISALCADSDETGTKITMGIICAACIVGGYALGQKSASKSPVKTTTNSANTFRGTKDFVANNVSKSVELVVKAWDNFMASKKAEIQRLLRESAIPQDKLDELISKTLFTETIDVSLMDYKAKLAGVAEDADEAQNLKRVKQECRDSFIAKIDEAANKQIAAYKSILDGIN